MCIRDSIHSAYRYLQAQEVDLVGKVDFRPNGEAHFYFRDLQGNLVEAVGAKDWFQNGAQAFGGVYGCTIGVSDIDKAREVYSDILGYDRVVYDRSGQFDDFRLLPGGKGQFRRVLLTHEAPRNGAFSPLLGHSEIELIQALDRPVRPIFENRLSGDLGYIHLCYDIRGMEALRSACAEKGYPFTVDSSNSFDMGEAAGHFSYREDPDGTLIEFVETHKVPILKKMNWYLNLKKRKPEKAFPRWMIKSLGFNRVKL